LAASTFTRRAISLAHYCYLKDSCIEIFTEEVVRFLIFASKPRADAGVDIDIDRYQIYKC
jgi:lysyl-tRNA synthetase class I